MCPPAPAPPPPHPKKKFAVVLLRYSGRFVEQNLKGSLQRTNTEKADTQGVIFHTRYVISRASAMSARAETFTPVLL